MRHGALPGYGVTHAPRGAGRRWPVVAALLSLICGVSGQSITSLTYGLPARTMGPTFSGVNTIPQAINQQVTYAGTLGNAMWLSLVDATLTGDGTGPCGDGDVAAATADSSHSGAIQASGKVVTVPQSTLLDASLLYAVCFADSGGLATDSSWADSRSGGQV